MCKWIKRLFSKSKNKKVPEPIVKPPTIVKKPETIDIPEEEVVLSTAQKMIVKNFESPKIDYYGKGVLVYPSDWISLLLLTRWDDSKIVVLGIAGDITGMIEKQEAIRLVKFFRAKISAPTKKGITPTKLLIIADNKQTKSAKNESGDYVVMLSHLLDDMKINGMWDEYLKWRRGK